MRRPSNKLARLVPGKRKRVGSVDVCQPVPLLCLFPLYLSVLTGHLTRVSHFDLFLVPAQERGLATMALWLFSIILGFLASLETAAFQRTTAISHRPASWLLHFCCTARTPWCVHFFLLLLLYRVHGISGNQVYIDTHTDGPGIACSVGVHLDHGWILDHTPRVYGTHT